MNACKDSENRWLTLLEFMKYSWIPKQIRLEREFLDFYERKDLTTA